MVIEFIRPASCLPMSLRIDAKGDAVKYLPEKSSATEVAFY